MAYPFIKCPDFKELNDRLCNEFDCQLKQGKNLHEEGGGSFPVAYFERVVNGKLLTYVMDVPADDTIIEVYLLRNICDRLQIPKKAFGFDLE